MHLYLFLSLITLYLYISLGQRNEIRIKLIKDKYETMLWKVIMLTISLGPSNSAWHIGMQKVLSKSELNF